MLPKKRKFTASDYETFSASSQGQEAPSEPHPPPGEPPEAPTPRPPEKQSAHAHAQPAVSVTVTRAEPTANRYGASQYQGQQGQQYAGPTDYTTSRPSRSEASDSSGVMDLSNKSSTSPPKPTVQGAVKPVVGPSPVPVNKALPLSSAGRMQSPSFPLTSGRTSAGIPGSSGVQIRRLSNAAEYTQPAYQPSQLSTNEEVAKHTAGGQGPKKFDINLEDWIGSRVLARRDKYFCPGVVNKVYEGYSVSILFDGEEQPLVYHEVLAQGEHDTVISDSVPASSQVSCLIMRLNLLRRKMCVYTLYLIRRRIPLSPDFCLHVLLGRLA